MGITIPAIAVAISMITAAATGSHVAGNDVGDIVAKTKALYEKTSSGELKFEQTDAGGKTDATLWFARGDKYRLEYPVQTIVSNGSRVWRYMPSRKQVVISKATRRMGQIKLSDILTLFPGDYNTSLAGSDKVNGRSVWVVNCTAGSGERIGDVDRATLYIDKKTYRFQKITVESTASGQMSIRVTSARYNISIPSSTFTFTPDSGTEVIDLTK
jgi:outer membrane lipoprotein-sorting protein